ncbi:ATP-binding protein [Nocardia sp. N13]|uniref:HAMP domain-containing sensor histidine kinase n=1 Tax=Nocardioides sp. N13(2025) TaxID=3453405 RepID=UPI003F776094
MTQDAAQARKGAGMSVAGWPLRRKIALALAIPLLLAATLGGLRVQGDYGDSRQAATSAKQVTIIQPAVDYLTASEAAMVAAQTDSAASQGDLIDAISDIITNAETLVQTRDSADLDEIQVAHVNALLDLSQAMRAEGAEDLGPATWIALVRQLESSVSQLVTSVNAAQETPEPRLEQLSQAMSGRLSLALQQGLLATTLSQSSSQELFSEIGVEAAAIDRLAGSVDGAEDQTALLRTQNTKHAGQIRDDSATNLDGRDAYVPYDEITEELVSGVTASLDEAASDAQRNALIGAVLTLIALGAAIFIAFVIARSLLEPIGRVREGALAVARHRLPDAVARIRAGQEPEPITTIDVTTNEEIGQVARAVDDLHRQAIHLASGEAQLRQTVNAMFVTLSRRSNSLVNQQLAQIERLEHDEEDPKRLESLFRLDHLASRMRRTADSLLILADAPNRAAGTFSLTVGEALQAATSGVQDYQRVQILSHLGTRVGDEAAADVVHLLTELVDNALTYSPPAEPVRLAAKLGADGVTITITDSGLGVPPAELDLLNRDLAHGAEATPDTARRMGLFVVSRLAERHGINASLARNPGGGMTATVLLPPSVLPELPQTAAPAAGAAAKSVETVTAKPVETARPAEAAAATAAPKRDARKLTRAEKAQAKAAEKAAEKQAASDAKAAERARAAEAKAAKKEAAEEADLEPPTAPAAGAAASAAGAAAAAPAGGESAGTPGRPSLDSLLPRREPGANMPRTGADAFLPPETSGATGPLFGKRTPEPAAEAEVTESTETAAEPTPAEKVAPVVPITALASRQRAQAEEARVAEKPVAQEPVAEPVAEPVVEEPAAEPARAHDPLSDPLPESAFDHTDEQQAAEQQVDETQVEAEADAPAGETAEVDRSEAQADDVEVDAADPLGLGGPSRQDSRPDSRPDAGSTEAPAEAPTEQVVEEPAAEVPDEPVAEPAVEAPAASLAADAGHTSGHTSGHNGLSHDSAPARNGGDSPIFKSMRSGWLTGDASEIHETEVDRGWEIAEHVAEVAPVAESTVTGLPRRAPGERLVPGSVTPPTAAKTRDPEAIRRRLQAHTAGVSRGRRAAQSSTQHTEAGPA